VPPEFYTDDAVAARQEVERLKGDSEFYRALKAERERGVTGPATQRWQGLHSKGWPAGQPVSLEAADAQAAARSEEQWGGYFAALRQQFDLSPANEAEIRAGTISAQTHQWAREEKARLLADPGFRARLLQGGQAEKQRWHLVVAMTGLRPV
jgi:hypothetical protein